MRRGTYIQKNAQADKKKVEWDGVNVPGLTMVGEIALERGQIDIPEFNFKRKIPDGVTTIPAVEMTYRTDKDTMTEQFIDDWWENKDVKQGVLIHTDAHGIEYKRQLLVDCEIVRKSKPAYDAMSPTYAQAQIVVVPWDIIDVT